MGEEERVKAPKKTLKLLEIDSKLEPQETQKENKSVLIR